MLNRGDIIQGSKGTYYVESHLVKGGMGRVYLGRAKQGNKVIIKEPLIVNDGQDDLRVEKLKTEGQILSGIKHNNIVGYIDSQDTGQTYYLVIDYIPGKTMKDAFWQNPTSENDAKKYAITVLETLGYLHNANIIHRDIKPQNILMPNNVPVLIDFGAAKLGYMQAPLTSGNTVVGTHGWSAPEQMQGIAAPRCDIYSLGAVLFFLLTGCTTSTYTKSDGTIKPPHLIDSRISPEISRVAIKALSFDPTQRYEITSDMIAELQGHNVIQSYPCLFCRGRKYELRREMTIGRSNSCDVFIDDPFKHVSKTHAKVYFDRGKYWIEDTNSYNGTFIQRMGAGLAVFDNVKKRALNNGDVIALCYKQGKGAYVVLTFKNGTP